MATKGSTISTMTKDKRISKEYRRLLNIFKNIGEDKLKLLEGLIYQASFMRVSLDDYQEDIKKNGYIEKFKQSEKLKPYERLRPVAQLYNAMNKNYQAVIKQLVEALPRNDERDKDELLEFLKK